MSRFGALAATLVMGRIAFIMVSNEFPPPANPHPEGGQVMLAIHHASSG